MQHLIAFTQVQTLSSMLQVLEAQFSHTNLQLQIILLYLFLYLHNPPRLHITCKVLTNLSQYVLITPNLLSDTEKSSAG